MLAVTLHFWDVSDSGLGTVCRWFCINQIVEEVHAARGGGL